MYIRGYFESYTELNRNKAGHKMKKIWNRKMRIKNLKKREGKSKKKY